MLLCCFSYIGNAITNSGYVDCGNGKGTYYTVEGKNQDEIASQIATIVEYTCSQNMD